MRDEKLESEVKSKAYIMRPTQWESEDLDRGRRRRVSKASCKRWTKAVERMTPDRVSTVPDFSKENKTYLCRSA